MSYKKENGFTLIELLVTILILGLLMAIAIPVFNGQRAKAKNSSAQTTLRNAQATASALRTDNDTYFSSTRSLLNVFDELRETEQGIQFELLPDLAQLEPGLNTNKNDRVFVSSADIEPNETDPSLLDIHFTATDPTSDSANIALFVASSGSLTYSAFQTNVGGPWFIGESTNGTSFTYKQTN